MLIIHPACHRLGKQDGTKEIITCQNGIANLLVDGELEVSLVVGCDVAVIGDVSNLLLHEAGDTGSGGSVARNVGVGFLRGDAAHLDDELEGVIHQTTVATLVRACTHKRVPR